MRLEQWKCFFPREKPKYVHEPDLDSVSPPPPPTTARPTTYGDVPQLAYGMRLQFLLAARLFPYGIGSKLTPTHLDVRDVWVQRQSRHGVEQQPLVQRGAAPGPALGEGRRHGFAAAVVGAVEAA